MCAGWIKTLCGLCPDEGGAARGRGRAGRGRVRRRGPAGHGRGGPGSRCGGGAGAGVMDPLIHDTPGSR